MSKALIAKRYAEALFQLAQKKEIVDSIESELLIVKEVFQQNPDFNTFLENPSLDGLKKKQLIDQAFKDFSQEVHNTLKLLIDRHNEEVVPAIVDGFVALANELKGIGVATVYSVRKLSEDEKQQLATVFAKKLSLNSLKIDNVVDPSVIGGIKLKVGNTVYDGSVKGKLERIERNIVSVN
ncbi:ATP synthase subunit delta [Paraliobacillus quinghaiensis]|uniref:ATP synthase subunit delta n=1 Tax=Paraliobacillus quinghaiensis TaxID=470815 RepID=A0A917WV22_9BACI|nr:F0F1 ATP synthase subunit delta [Paraliobacillus quinghaiensis]GGM32592.1 ATP synthase subunit delta [Paraliobacillus quinghaiensis]